MSLISQTKAAMQLYRLLLKDYYTQEAPYRLLDVTSYFFPFTVPFCQSIIEYIKGKEFEILSEETLAEEKWAHLKETIEEVKQLFGIEDEIIIAKDLSGKFPDYAISGNIIFANEERAFSLTENAQKFAIAHELSHYVHRHLVKRTYMNCAWIIIDFSCITLICYKSRLYFIALGVAEIAIFHIERAAFRRQEKEADLTAIEKLQSNQGAQEAFVLDLIFDGIDFLKENPHRFNRQPTTQELTQHLIGIGLLIHTSIVGKIALTHPTHVARLHYCGLE